MIPSSEQTDHTNVPCRDPTHLEPERLRQKLNRQIAREIRGIVFKEYTACSIQNRRHNPSSDEVQLWKELPIIIPINPKRIEEMQGWRPAETEGRNPSRKQKGPSLWKEKRKEWKENRNSRQIQCFRKIQTLVYHPSSWYLHGSHPGEESENTSTAFRVR